MYINGQNLCIGCMRPLSSYEGCSFCGLRQEEYNPIPRCLKPGTELAGRYVTGKVLGEGSFGITYMGWDQEMLIPVAVKEYFPSDMVSRDVICGSDNSVYLYESEKKNDYKDYLKKFWQEAKCLSQFNQVAGVVSVLDFFYENNTAYIVMQHIDGISVKKYISEHGSMPADRVLETIRPVLLALEQVHNTGIVHRDISPDNLMIKKDGSLVLIDFGAARMRNVDNTKTMTVMFKRGFSPEEQYRYKGRWGAYTDVYSICATIYFMITGKPPIDSVIRALEDSMPSLVSMKELNIPARQRRAIMKGMAVNAKDRWQNIGDLYAALYHEEKAERIVYRRPYRKVAVVIGLMAIAGIGAGGSYHWENTTEAENERPVQQAEQASPQPVERADEVPEETTVPDMILVEGETKASVEEKLKQYGNAINIVWDYKYSGKIKKGRIVSQSIPQGEKITGDNVPLTLVVSRGARQVSVPELTGLSSAAAEKKLKEKGLKCEMKQVERQEQAGTVVAQDIRKGKKVPKATVVTITVSMGRTAVPNSIPTPTKAPARDAGKQRTDEGKNRSDRGAAEGDDFAGIIR